MTQPIPPFKQVTFLSNNIPISAHLYPASPSAPSRKNAAIVIAHPAFGVKEQTATTHAQHLSAAGFHALVFDAAYQGESGGLPRGLEDPHQRAEDARAAVSYLCTREEIDAQRIGVLGICASGGYVPFAAQTDTRMRAVATVSGVDFGRILREGLGDKGVMTREVLQAQIEGANALRTAEARDGEPRLVKFLPDEKKDIPPEAGSLMVDGWDYYRTPRGHHPRSTGAWVGRSLDLCANFDAYRFNQFISPRPLLMIAGENADTRYFSEDGIAAAKEPKELFLVPDMGHIDLYDDLSVSGSKLVEFFIEHLGA